MHAGLLAISLQVRATSTSCLLSEQTQLYWDVPWRCDVLPTVSAAAVRSHHLALRSTQRCACTMQPTDHATACTTTQLVTIADQAYGLTVAQLMVPRHQGQPSNSVKADRVCSDFAVK
jgi:hypothetical protein